MCRNAGPRWGQECEDMPWQVVWRDSCHLSTVRCRLLTWKTSSQLPKASVAGLKRAQACNKLSTLFLFLFIELLGRLSLWVYRVAFYPTYPTQLINTVKMFAFADCQEHWKTLSIPLKPTPWDGLPRPWVLGATEHLNPYAQRTSGPSGTTTSQMRQCNTQSSCTH